MLQGLGIETVSGSIHLLPRPRPRPRPPQPRPLGSLPVLSPWRAPHDRCTPHTTAQPLLGDLTFEMAAPCSLGWRSATVNLACGFCIRIIASVSLATVSYCELDISNHDCNNTMAMPTTVSLLPLQLDMFTNIENTDPLQTLRTLSQHPHEYSPVSHYTHEQFGPHPVVAPAHLAGRLATRHLAPCRQPWRPANCGPKSRTPLDNTPSVPTADWDGMCRHPCHSSSDGFVSVLWFWAFNPTKFSAPAACTLQVERAIRCHESVPIVLAGTVHSDPEVVPGNTSFLTFLILIILQETSHAKHHMSASLSDQGRTTLAD